MLGRRRNRASRRKSGIQILRLLRWLRLWLRLRLWLLLLLLRLLRSWIVSDRRGIRDRRRHCSHWRRSTGHSDVFHSALLPLFVAGRCYGLCAAQAVPPGDDIVLERTQLAATVVTAADPRCSCSSDGTFSCSAAPLQLLAGCFRFAFSSLSLARHAKDTPERKKLKFEV